MGQNASPRTDRDLIARIGRSGGGKAGYKQLVRELGLGGGHERRLLREQLDSLVKRGELIKLKDDQWGMPQREPAPAEAPRGRQPQTGGRWDGFEAAARSGRDRLVSGRLDLHRDGFGFVRPDTAAANGPRDDIFIPPNEINGAMQGDLVLVDEAPSGRDGRRSGRVARVLTRRNPTVVGIFHYAGSVGGGRREMAANSIGLRENFVTPLDDRIAGPIAIPAGYEVVIPPSESPHRMLGEEARRQQADWATASTMRSPEEPGFEDADPGRPLVAAAESGQADFVDGTRPFRRRRKGQPERETLPATNTGLSPLRRTSAPLVEKTSVEGNTREAGPVNRWPLEGLAVDVEIVRYASPGHPALGRILEVLGPPDAFGVDVEIIIRKHHIPHTFPAAVLAEAAERANESVASASEEELSAREDFRGLPVVTIDGETARDFDDAVLVRPLANGNTELQVHIADVSHYVRPGSPLDTEARVRGTSVYFPDRAVPMLPHQLSSGMCSLLPKEDRFVQSCIMEIDARGEIAGYRVAEGLIRSVRRCTYTSVQHCLNASPEAERWNKKQVPLGDDNQKDNDNSKDDSNGTRKAKRSSRITPEPSAEDLAERERVGLEQPELPAAIDAMLELALRLNRKRERRGSIDFDLPEPVVEFDPDGNMKAIVRSERGWAHRLIEEFMLSANECIATWLESQGIASIYRIHEMPDPKRIVEFEDTAAGFGQSLGLGNLPVRKLTMKSDRRESRQRSARGKDVRAPQQHEIPQSIPVTPQMYQRLVRRIAGTPEERILSYLMLRSLKQARYAEKNEGHFALASPSYTHFTSPIRRYPDLIVHRLLRTMLERGADPRGGPIRSEDAQPWAAELARAQGKSHTGQARRNSSVESPISAEELNDIAVESSQSERRAADAERELIEWKKMKFMADKIGDDFSAMILSVTKYGFFVELDEMFIEGLVPLGSLAGDFYSFRDTDRTICGARTGHCFAAGQRVEVLLDRIDRQQRRLQFALVPGTEPKANTGAGKGSLRAGKTEAKKAKAKVKTSAKKRKKR